jgi:YHS domain-containing protein
MRGMTMKRREITIAALTALLTIGISSYAEEKQQVTEQKKQTTCPVMGGKINKKLFVDVKGKRIYVCCAGCISKIKANPDKYIKQMEAEGIVLEEAPKQENAKENDKKSQE